MPKIEFENLTFLYPGMETPALDRLSLEISKGSFVGIIGANNAGKSTLCAAISGILPLYHGKISGRVKIDAIPVDSPDQLSGRVGMVLPIPGHQMSGVRYTVFEEAAFGLENLGFDREAMMSRVKEALAETGLTGVEDRSPFQLSGGQQQRLAIASVLATDPDILVLDEPTTFLDPRGGARIFDILSRLHRKGKTIVIAAQCLEWIAEYADRVIGLNQGKLVMDGPPEKVLTSSSIKEIGLEWTRYTQAADLARAKGLWEPDRPLAASFSAAVKGFEKK